MKVDKNKLEIEALQELISLLSDNLGEEDNFKAKEPLDPEAMPDDVTGVTVEGDSPEALAAGLDKAKDLVSDDSMGDDDVVDEEPVETDEEKQERIRNLLRR